jgi:23S rRNA pseudouridine1911/1915/1917 synthase
VAKTDSAHQRLVEQFKSREVKKWYLAYLHGHPSRPAGEWNGPIGRHRIHRQKMTVLPTGKSALSRFRVLQPGNLASLVEVEIRTGRTHQIRVHASHAGHPVVGDHIYGRKRNWESEAEVSRHLLHAARLEVAHPITGEILKIEATPPEEFGKFANWLAQRSD